MNYATVAGIFMNSIFCDKPWVAVRLLFTKRDLGKFKHTLKG